MELDFELSLAEREPDRVLVQVALMPRHDARPHVDGVSVQLLDGEGQSLCPRLLLAVSGVLHGPMVSCVELHTDGPIPVGAKAAGTVWQGGAQLEATCPVDDLPRFENHMRGAGVRLVHHDLPLRPLDDHEHAALARRFPWILELRAPELSVIDTDEAEEGEVEEAVHSFCEKYGLCGEDEAWLNDLMNED